jgi:hypothetical protein
MTVSFLFCSVEKTEKKNGNIVFKFETVTSNLTSYLSRLNHGLVNLGVTQVIRKQYRLYDYSSYSTSFISGLQVPETKKHGQE